jgi:hypothetical protein
MVDTSNVTWETKRETPLITRLVTSIEGEYGKPATPSDVVSWLRAAPAEARAEVLEAFSQRVTIEEFDRIRKERDEARREVSLANAERLEAVFEADSALDKINRVRAELAAANNARNDAIARAEKAEREIARVKAERAEMVVLEARIDQLERKLAAERAKASPKLPLSIVRMTERILPAFDPGIIRTELIIELVDGVTITKTFERHV